MYKCLLDTRASLTVASSAFIQKTPIYIGCLTFSHPVRITHDFHYPFILGFDFLNENKTSIDFESQQLILFDENSVALSVCLTCSAEGYARAVRTMLIPQRSETNEYLHQKERCYCVTRTKPYAVKKRTSHYSSMLVKVENGKTMLHILSPTIRIFSYMSEKSLHY